MHEENCWQAVVRRDAAADGTFVYAVRSTGIYCRPSCAARRPGRAQVVFFARPAAAEAAGFRACRRCGPGVAATPAPPSAPIAQACRYIEEHLDSPPTLETLAVAVGLSPFHLQRTFTRAIGCSPRQYAAARRVERLKAGLQAGDGVTGAQYTAGYGSSSRLYEQAPAQLGMTPGTYRRGGAGMTIGYAVAPCALGYLLLAGTVRGVCAVRLGDSPAELEAGLAAEFPAATIAADPAGLAPWVAAILSYLAGAQALIDLPLDVQATAFQARVWAALRAIPAGTTRSYSAIAAGLGQPGAARAVARACATNPVALVIPCHRAVHEDGTPGGYRWGAARKQALLAGERGA